VYISIFACFFVCGCEALSLTCREERRLRVIENGMLMKIFGPKSDEITGDCIRQHNEELCDLYSSPNIIPVIKLRSRWAGYVACMTDGRDTYRVIQGYGGEA